VAPAGAKLAKWLTAWARDAHGGKLEPAAAGQLVEIVGPELGLLDQELAKLAAFAGAEQPITAEMVQDLVGGWRTKTTWEMLDAALAGDSREALLQLDKLLLSGESPIAIIAQMGSSIRRFAAATRLIERAEAEGRRISLRAALEQAGVKPFVLAKAEQQLRQLGRQRAGGLYRAVLEVDLGLKGKGALPPRLLLERLIASLGSSRARSTTGAV
jgi:DNA polymerase-3 subunit delta